jgi:SAM-dependent methyltransferase
MSEWGEAQRHEAAVWKEWGDEPVISLQRRAHMLAAYCFLDAQADVELERRTLLEIGAAGAPVISFLPAKRRLFVDPLLAEIQDLFKQQYEGLGGSAEFYSSPAEDLHFIVDGSIDAAFCLNVLDHTQHPITILQQLHRKLAPNGRLLLSVDCYSAVWLGLRRLRLAVRGKTKNDILHPHHFTLSSALALTSRAGFVASRCLLAPADGLSKSSNYTTTSEFPLDQSWKAFIKQANRIYIVLRKNAD